VMSIDLTRERVGEEQNWVTNSANNHEYKPILASDELKCFLFGEGVKYDTYVDIRLTEGKWTRERNTRGRGITKTKSGQRGTFKAWVEGHSLEVEDFEAPLRQAKRGYKVSNR